MSVYERFIEELDGVKLDASESATSVLARVMRAVKRAQMVHDGELDPLAERTLPRDDY